MAALDDDTRARLAGDGVIGSLLLMHGLYPVPLEQRVREALDSVRPYMESHGGNVELLGLEDGVARIRLQGHCVGCAASASTLELGIRQALEATAPELEGLEVEGVLEEAHNARDRAFEVVHEHMGQVLLDPFGLAVRALEPQDRDRVRRDRQRHRGLVTRR